MGTNYYFFTKNKKLCEKYFPFDENVYGREDDGYTLVDFPDFGYEIHLNKLSFGWSPLFQEHNHAYKTFAELETFYNEHKDDLKIYNEYGDELSFDDYKTSVVSHSKRERKPLKWVYKVNSVFDKDGHPSLYTEECSEEEADLFIPINHAEYMKTECAARKKYNVSSPPWISSEFYNEVRYTRDPDYEFDWTFGDFS